MKRLFISDIHLSDALASYPMTGHPYTWCDRSGVERLAGFLNSSEIKDADQLFLVGDVVDTWVHPIDVKPPTVAEILADATNKPVIDALRTFAETPGKQLIWMPGNHDMSTVAADVHAISGKIVFGPRFDEYPLRVRHGHEGSLFNAPDPGGHPYPVGYYITRLTATGVNRGHAQPPMDLWTVFKNAAEVAAAVRGKPLSECIFDVILEASGVSANDRVLMPDGNYVPLSGIRVMFDNLPALWKAAGGDVATAVMTEWDPWYDLPVGKPHLNIVGHSHLAMLSRGDAFGAYLNTGAWCSTTDTATYVQCWDEGTTRMAAQVMHWNTAAMCPSGVGSIARLSR